MPSARRQDRDSEFPAIGDYAIIGDCHSAALVSRQGAIEWCCLPRFDSGSAFGAILDRERGGTCSVTPLEDGEWHYSRRYLDDTLLLQTTIDGPSGEATVLDLFLTGPETSNVDRRLVRVIECGRGAMELEVRVAPRFDYGAVRPWIRRLGLQTHSAVGGNDALFVWCEHELVEEPAHELSAKLSLNAGDRIRLLLGYWRPELIEGVDMEDHTDAHKLDAEIERTAQWWREWATSVRLEGRDEGPTRRSALTLKALTHLPTGAVVAAATTSLPEVLGGVRNWDYRFAWIRDSSFSSRAFAAVGCVHEADAFRNFMIRSAAGHAEDLQVLYGIGGERRLGDSELPLAGYRGSAPPRIGNSAVSQIQLDAYGEIVNLMWRWHRRGHSPSDDDWRFVVSLIDHAAEHCTHPDSGLWEWPGEPDHFVHSKVLCWSALDRGIRLADECMRRAPVRRWTRVRDGLREEIDTRGFDADRNTYTQAYDRPELDGALLLLPTVEYVDWTDPRMLGTVDAVREELDAGDGLLYRYRREDGLPGREGVFLCCSFWLVECLARGGRLPEARAVFDRAMSCANDLGLFSEEMDPDSGELLGNFPQALTHLAHIDAAVALSECERAL